METNDANKMNTITTECLPDQPSNTRQPQVVPKKAFDSEYMTEWRREVQFLRSKGIRYTHVRVKNDYGVRIRQYKYTKTPELFKALYEYYLFVSNEKEYGKLEKAMNEAVVKDTVSHPLTSFDVAVWGFINGNGN